MTVFGWDTSHYDDANGIDLAVMRQAVREGIAFVTAKVGEGGNYDDPADAGTLTAARDAGIRVLGGYYVVRTPAKVGASLADQVTHCVSLMDRELPWWRDFPGWFGQIDLERWSYDIVAAADGIEFGHRLQDKTGRRAVMYASKGQYGDQLAAWDGLLWNANYPSARQAPFRELYPGGHGAGWVPYSGRANGADLWQYASAATIAGLTTCDANAFRGTLAELLALITPAHQGDIVTAPTAAEIENKVWHTAGSATDGESAGTTLGEAGKHATSADAKLDEVLTKLDALTAAVANLPAAVVAALPPVVTGSVGDVTFEGTAHLGGPAPV